MTDRSLSFDLIRSFAARREVDLELVAARAPVSIALRGMFDGYGDFFSILAADVEYMDILGALTLGDLRIRGPSAASVVDVAEVGMAAGHRFGPGARDPNRRRVFLGRRRP